MDGTDQEKLTAIGEKSYKAQGVWFLNAFWDGFAQAEAERVWEYAQRMAAIDTQRKADGNALDEFQAHQFLEQCKETLTVLQMREHLRTVGIDKIKLVPFIHYLIFRYKVDWHVLVNAPQGNPEEIARAQRMLDEVQAALAEAQARADEAKAAERQAQAREAEAKRDEAEAKRTEEEAKRTEAEAKRTESEAKSREAEAQARADELRAAQQELEAALAEVKAQEDAYNGRTEELKRKSEEGSLVQRNKAKNELAQHLGEDPLPLRRAKITLEAAVKKADRATKAAQEAADQAAQARQIAEQARKQAESARKQAEAARKAAEQAREAAEEARREAEAAREAADEAVSEAERKVAEAEAFLEEIKRIAGNGKGALWWIDRELHEAKAYMPASKGGYKKAK